jgi:hypothetical protein
VMPVANKRDLCAARSRPFLILSLLTIIPLATFYTPIVFIFNIDKRL